MTSPGLLHRTADCAKRLTVCLRTDPLLVGQLAFWRLSLPLLKRAMSVNALTELMWSPSAASPDEEHRVERVAVIKDVIGRAGRLLVSTNCLERSLVLYRLLSQAGAQPALILGTRRDAPSVAGHAWIEVDGLPVCEPEREAYEPIVAFGPRGSRCALTELQHLA
jgi:transglutaminase superfamily protein